MWVIRSGMTLTVVGMRVIGVDLPKVKDVSYDMLQQKISQSVILWG